MSKRQSRKSRPSSGMVGADALARLAAKHGTRHRLISASSRPGPLLEGVLETANYPSGLLLHVTDGLELDDLVSAIELPPGLTFCVTVEGSLDFKIGGRAVRIDARRERERASGGVRAAPGAPDAPTGPGSEDCTSDSFAMNLLRPALLERKIRKGVRVRKVNICVQHKWLETQLDERLAGRPRLSAFLDRHLETPCWSAPPHLLALAEQLLAPAPYDTALRNLYVESKAYEIIAASLQCIGALDDAQPERAPRRADGAARVQRGAPRANGARIARYLEDKLLARDASLTFSLETTARDLNMSVSKLQRTFKASYGQTVFEYIRQRRLEIARDALLHKKLAIGQAAYLAGYRHRSNFAAAFKKAFGMPPGSLNGSGADE